MDDAVFPKWEAAFLSDDNLWVAVPVVDDAEEPSFFVEEDDVAAVVASSVVEAAAPVELSGPFHDKWVEEADTMARRDPSARRVRGTTHLCIITLYSVCLEKEKKRENEGKREEM